MLDQVTMARQLGRWWARNSALGLLFSEPDSSAKANIYATPLPQLTHRLSPAVSITAIPAAADDAMAATANMSFRIFASARTPSIAESITRELVGLLWPDEQPILPREGDHYPGLIGVPSEAGAHTLWRATEFVQVSTPFTSSTRTPEGEIVSQMAIDVHAVDTTVAVE